MINLELKTKLWQHSCGLLQNRIATLKGEIDALNEAMESESKSSAGDKHETGRAMMHLDLERTAKQLADARETLAGIERMNLKTPCTVARYGALIESSAGIYFLGIPLGRVAFEGHDYFLISLESPVGKLLIDKTAGETITLNGREITILSVV